MKEYHPSLASAPEVRQQTDNEPRWPAVLAVLATAALHFALPEPFRFGPGWLLLVVVSLFLVPTILAHRAGRLVLNRVLGHIVLGSLTASMVWSLSLLIMRLPAHRDTPQVLLRAAVTLWVANVLVFASWYWRLDAGGPNARDLRRTHTEGAFLFPQMMIPGKHDGSWRPGFVDYLFLAFNTSTAFSPTDVPVLSRWAKLMMIVQASISLATVALIAARAVNIL
ncbi:MAG TPA: hypothetical protein VKX49_28560 [Bryobacteraceae bacterium]|nr:hypothetical protein [Bryobacteraceae bacterium]